MSHHHPYLDSLLSESEVEDLKLQAMNATLDEVYHSIGSASIAPEDLRSLLEHQITVPDSTIDIPADSMLGHLNNARAALAGRIIEGRLADGGELTTWGTINADDLARIEARLEAIGLYLAALYGLAKIVKPEDAGGFDV